MAKFEITTDVFTIPYKDTQSILYAPAVGYAGVVNQDLIDFLSELESIDGEMIDPDKKQIVDFFIDKGIVNGFEYVVPMILFEEKINPTKLTLFPTNQCNLNCRYCYASAYSHDMQTMEWDVAGGAVDYFINHLKQKQRDKFYLEFHGGGEPLYAWNLVQRIVTYTEEKCRENNFDLEVYSSTNGILTELQLTWLVGHFSFLNVSFDGLPRVQNYHRAMTNDRESFEFIDRTLKFLDQHKFSYAIRCAVSKYNENLLDETVEFITKNYNPYLLFLEPVNDCACNNPGDKNMAPDLYKFADNFIRLESKCESLGLRLEYSGAQFEKVAPTFCYVGTDNFAVTPDASLTNCWEVTSKDHPLADTFIFGRMLPLGDLEYDRQKLEFLRSLSVNRLEYCQDCFAKWHCSGDCAARTQLLTAMNGKPVNQERCETNRKLIAHRITKLVERKEFFRKI